MNLRQYWLIFRARYKLALAVALGTLMIAIPVILLLPRQYTATTSMVLDIRSPDPLTALLMPSNMATQEDIIKSDRVAQKVVAVLKLTQDPALQAQWQEAKDRKGSFEVWLVERLQKSLVINPGRRESNTITIEFKAANPRFAAAAANAFAQAYVEAMIELKVEPAKQYAHWFGEQGKALRDQLEAAQARLAAFQQKKGIISREDTPDAESARLNELTTQLTAAQAERVEARSKERSIGAGNAHPDVLASNVIQGLRSEIARQEAKLKDAAGNLGRNHPQFRGMEAELAELKARLAAEMQQAAGSYSAASAAGKESELQAAVDAQRRKLLALRVDRDQLAVLQRDVEAAKNAYEAVERRFNHTNVESQATQTNVFMLRPAVEPLTPSSPRLWRDSLAALLVGIVLGLGAALARELLDRRVRCVDDVIVQLEMPVLVVLARAAKRTALAGEAQRARLALSK